MGYCYSKVHKPREFISSGMKCRVVVRYRGVTIRAFGKEIICSNVGISVVDFDTFGSCLGSHYS